VLDPVDNERTPAPPPSEATEIALNLIEGATIAVAPGAAFDLVA
jgi:hypothetical protein